MVNSCFIRKNTKELREKLEALGFRNPEVLNSDPHRSYGLLARLIKNKKRHVIGMPFSSEETTGLFLIDEFLKERPEIVDCGEDEELFLSYCNIINDESK